MLFIVVNIHKAGESIQQASATVFHLSGTVLGGIAERVRARGLGPGLSGSGPSLVLLVI